MVVVTIADSHPCMHYKRLKMLHTRMPDRTSGVCGVPTIPPTGIVGLGRDEHVLRAGGHSRLELLSDPLLCSVLCLLTVVKHSEKNCCQVGPCHSPSSCPAASCPPAQQWRDLMKNFRPPPRYLSIQTTTHTACTSITHAFISLDDTVGCPNSLFACPSWWGAYPGADLSLRGRGLGRISSKPTVGLVVGDPSCLYQI